MYFDKLWFKVFLASVLAETTAKDAASDPWGVFFVERRLASREAGPLFFEFLRGAYVCRTEDMPEIRLSPFSSMDGVTFEAALQGMSDGGIRNLIDYHWRDGKDKERDYRYLESLYEDLVPRLAESLNSIHETSHSPRYWEIICGAWLLSHISVIFDRWQISNTGIDAHLDLFGDGHAAEKAPTSFGYQDYAASAAHSLGFNMLILKAIGIYQATGRFPLSPEAAAQEVREIKYGGGYPRQTRFSPWRHRGLLRDAKRLGATLYAAMARKAFSSQKIVFVSSYIRREHLGLLQLRLGQLPLLDFPFFGLDMPQNSQVHTQMRASMQSLLFNSSKYPSNCFEAFLLETIATYIPRSAVESYQVLCEWSNSLKSRACLIVTSNAQHGDEYFKNWAAEMTEKGVRLLICEHGGSFPIRDYLFGFEDRIADVRVQTMPLSGAKYRRVRAPSYLGSKGKLKDQSIGKKSVLLRRSRDLLLVPYQGSRFALRADSQPASIQWLQAASQSVVFLKSLDDSLLSRAVVKAHPGAVPEADSAVAIQLAVGNRVRVTRKTLRSSIRRAGFVVCTYPQTTFSEAMLSGKPVILLYDEDLHGIHPETVPLMRRLEQAEIAFRDPKRAAQHLDRFFFDPSDWWGSSTCFDARGAFLEALDCDSGFGSGPWMEMLGTELSLGDQKV